jgi:cytochrome P450
MVTDTITPGGLPPGPLVNVRHFMKAPLRFFTHLSQCGDGAVVPFSLLWMRCYLIVHPEGVHHVLTRGPETYSRMTPDTSVFRVAIGQSLLTTDGPPWLSTRRLVAPVFSRASVSAFGDTITAITAAALDRWEQRLRGPASEPVQPLDMVEEMRQLTLATVAQALFSVDSAALPLGPRIDALAAVIDKMFRSPAIFLASLGIPLLPYPGMRTAIRRLDRELYQVIDEHLAGASDGTGSYRDLLTHLAQARDDAGHSLTRKELRNELLDLLLAGQETTASMLTWALALLALHPSVEEQLYAELHEVLAEGAPTTEDLQKLPGLAAIVQETLRLYPSAWVIVRKALKDDEIDGHRIAKQSLVFLSPWVTQRHAAWWQDPEEFRPERFAPGSSSSLRGAYYPFGLGPHRCVGEQLALLEAKLVLATVVQRYRLRLKEGHSIAPGVFPALRPRHGLPMFLDPR